MAFAPSKAKNMQLVALMTGAVEGADEKAIMVAALTLAIVHARATEMTREQFVWLAGETWPTTSQGPTDGV